MTQREHWTTRRADGMPLSRLTHWAAAIRGAAAVRVLRLMWGVGPWRTTWCSLGALVAALSNLTVFVSVGALVRSLGDGSPKAETWFWFWLFCAAPVMIVGQHMVVQTQAPVLTRKVLVRVHQLIARSLLSSSDSPGDRAITERAAVLARDWRVRHGLGGLWELLAARLTAVLSAGLLLQWHWWIPLVLVPVFVRVSIDYEAWLAKVADDGTRGRTVPEQDAGYLAQVMVSPAYAKEVRLFGLADWLRQQYAQAANLILTRSDTRSRAAYRQVVLTGGAMSLCTGAAFALLAYDSFSGGVSTSTAITAALAIVGLQGFLPSGDLQAAVNKVAALARSIDLKPATADGESRALDGRPSSLKAGSGAIVLRDVSFTYPGAPEPTISSLNLSVAAGEMVAIVGANGSGKSTLVKLLTGAVRPDRGLVTVNGVPPRAATENGSMAAVLQDPVHYPFSLQENVTLEFGSDGVATDEQRQVFEQVEGLASALPRNYATVLSSAYRGGVDLSGGEWQRVAFARASLSTAKGAPILIMDEPSAALDAFAERDFNQSTIPGLEGVTKVLISHRLSSVRVADRIVVLSRTGGQILECGSHDELMAMEGAYANLFRLQAAHYSSSIDYDVW